VHWRACSARAGRERESGSGRECARERVRRDGRRRKILHSRPRRDPLDVRTLNPQQYRSTARGATPRPTTRSKSVRWSKAGKRRASHAGGATGGTELACAFDAMECTFGCQTASPRGKTICCWPPLETVGPRDSGPDLPAIASLGTGPGLQRVTAHEMEIWVVFQVFVQYYFGSIFSLQTNNV
jgi:hypothetical protein